MTNQKPLMSVAMLVTTLAGCGSSDDSEVRVEQFDDVTATTRVTETGIETVLTNDRHDVLARLVWDDAQQKGGIDVAESGISRSVDFQEAPPTLDSAGELTLTIYRMITESDPTQRDIISICQYWLCCTCWWNGTEVQCGWVPFCAP